MKNNNSTNTANTANTTKRTFVMSDVHGYKGFFERMCETIGFSEADEMHVIGDAIDRGPDSIPLLQRLMGMENVSMYLGNHELMMLDCIRSRKQNMRIGNPDAWFMGANGGQETLGAFSALPQEEQDRIQTYIEESWVQRIVEVDGEKYWLSHSSILPTLFYGEEDCRTRDTEWEDAYNAVWRSPFRADAYEAPSNYMTDRYTHIIGHVPVFRLNHKVPPMLCWGKTVTGNPIMDRMYAAGWDGKRSKYPIVDIDGGCAMVKTFRKEGCLDKTPAGLFCMQLEKEADGSHKVWMTGCFGVKEGTVYLDGRA